MNPTFEPNDKQPPANRHGAASALLSHLDDDNPELARVAAAQQLLFPAAPREVSGELGLSWWAVVKLYEDGWLSFPPEATAKLDEAQEAELRFVGSLVNAGCDRSMLALVLGNLPKPYAYDLKRLYFDWLTRRWRLLPDPRSHPEAVFADWLELLIQTGDSNSLSGIGELAQEALSRVGRP
jgi:hypothetical protein